MVNLPAIFTCCVSVALPFNERTTHVGANVCRVITLHYARLIPYGNLLLFCILIIIYHSFTSYMIYHCCCDRIGVYKESKSCTLVLAVGQYFSYSNVCYRRMPSALTIRPHSPTICVLSVRILIIYKHTVVCQLYKQIVVILT